jgi:hypothetical protein
MDLGRLKLPIGQTYPGNEAQALQDVFVAMSLLQKDVLLNTGRIDILASATVNAGKAVAIVSGQVKHADAATPIPAIGICVQGALAGQKAGVIMFAGFISGLTGLTANSWIYLGNAGALLFAKPGAGFIQGLGYALSTTELFVSVSAP